MQINTKEFQAVANTILFAAELDKSAANLELMATGNDLLLSVTNKEYFVTVRFQLEQEENFRAVVDAPLFLNLVSGLTAETFDLSIVDNTVVIKAGRSKYKAPLIYENEELMRLPRIDINNKTVEMTIKNDILKSILNVNSKEILKVKNIDVDELRKLYYIDQHGCFTYTTGACLNSFELEQDVKLLLNDKIVKLFKLFNSDVYFSFGCDFVNGIEQHKVTFETEDIYVAALVNCDPILLNKFIGPCAATSSMIKESYTNHVVVAVNELLAAVNRLMLFTKNSVSTANMKNVLATVTLNDDGMTIVDAQGNLETVQVENGSYVGSSYTMRVNIADIKLIIEAYKNDHITINCGNGRAVVITHGLISNLISEQGEN